MPSGWSQPTPTSDGKHESRRFHDGSWRTVRGAPHELPAKAETIDRLIVSTEPQPEPPATPRPPRRKPVGYRTARPIFDLAELDEDDLPMRVTDRRLTYLALAVAFAAALEPLLWHFF